MIFKGTKVVNNRPRRLEDGGFVYRAPKMSLKQIRNDSVHAILQPGEIVIPKRLAPRIKRYLHANKIRLPGL
jgi:hypothetical protein